ncbi:MAG: nucleoside triphosphate pyrophosphohydrolase [Saprospiraceae bacterium]|nr:nucleoside triphosphate pyrophosphohydrolase [Saprospiraceae bacterium]
MQKEAVSFLRLLEIINDLRERCPWDKKQTIESLRSLTLEESYELSEEILKGNPAGIREELGDLLLHIVFYARIMQETEDFGIYEVTENLCEKLISRHPHVYGEIKLNDEEEVKRNWEKLKLKEGKKGLLEGLPASLPSLVKAFRMQDKARQVGFEWPDKEQVWHKVEEEMREFRIAADSGSQEDKEEEFGDVLFSLVNYARHHGIDPDLALEKVNSKFKSRFEYMETHAGQHLSALSLEQMDQLWEQAKQMERKIKY